MSWKNPKVTLHSLSVHLTTGFLLALILIPMFLIISVSFTPPSGFFGQPNLIPTDPTLEAWKNGIQELKKPLMNSFIIASGTAILSLIISIPSAYVFGRKEFRGKKMAFYTVIISMLFPYLLLLIPISDLWDRLGLFNTYYGLWIAYQIFVTPFSIWILRDFFEKLPTNLEEAAMVYGCSQFSAFLRVILPMTAPALAAVGFLAFLTGWNDFLFANVLTIGNDIRPAVVTLYMQIGGGGGERVYWGKLMVQSLIIGLPPTVLYIAAQSYLSDALAVES